MDEPERKPDRYAEFDAHASNCQSCRGPHEQWCEVGQSLFSAAVMANRRPYLGEQGEL